MKVLCGALIMFLKLIAPGILVTLNSCNTLLSLYNPRVALVCVVCGASPKKVLCIPSIKSPWCTLLCFKNIITPGILVTLNSCNTLLSLYYNIFDVLYHPHHIVTHVIKNASFHMGPHVVDLVHHVTVVVHK